MLSLALSSWSLHRHLPYYGTGSWSPEPDGEVIPIQTFPALAQSYGIAALEICQSHLATDDPPYIAMIAEVVRAAGCRVINVPIDAAGLAQGEPADLDTLRRWINVAATLGSTAVRINSGHVGALPEAVALDNVVRGYRELAAYCADRQLLLLLENHWGLSAAPATIMAIHEAVGAPNFRLCPDFGNFAPEVRLDGLRRMLPHAAIVHAKVLDVGPDGEHPAFDLGACFA
ncbi:MAG: sugar phosphate isomerase/epimerase family protein, partial [Chloroflexota bacterium]